MLVAVTEGDSSSSSSSYHTDDTLPNTPAPWEAAAHSGHNGDFARLRPLSELAKDAFLTVSARILREPGWAVNARRFMTIDDDGTGYYHLDMTVSPLSIATGWVLGTDAAVVDIMLVDPGADLAATARVAHRHCQIAFGPEGDGLLMRAQPGREIILDGREVVTFDPRMLGRHTGVQIGALSYIFDYTSDFPQPLFRRQLAEMRARRGWPNTEVIPTLTPTPGPDGITYRGFHIEKASLYGASATVSYGRRLSDSRPVVAKRLKVPNTRGAIATARNEIRNLQHFAHPGIVHLAHGFSPDPAVFGEFDTPMLEVILVMEPALPQTLVDLVRTGQGTLADARDLLADVLDALAYLHSRGYMHHDLKPANIGVSLSRRPPRAVLLDLGHTRITAASRDHMLGTIAYLAPEVVALKRVPDGPPFDARADIWSVGLSFAELVLHNVVSTRWRAQGIAQADHIRLQQWLKAGRSTAFTLGEPIARVGTLFDALDTMLEWDSSKRPAADVALRRIMAVSREPGTFKTALITPNNDDDGDQPVGDVDGGDDANDDDDDDDEHKHRVKRIRH